MVIFVLYSRKESLHKLVSLYGFAVTTLVGCVDLSDALVAKQNVGILSKHMRPYRRDLSILTMKCNCGVKINRDQNATINIRTEGLRMLKEAV